MIFVECFADHLLFSQLKVEHDEIHSGIGEVGNRMKSKRMQGKKCLGIIDNDKRQSDYFKYDFEKREESENLIFLKHHEEERHYLLKIKPAVEGFILTCAMEAEISPSKYRLPTTIPALKSLTRKKEILKNRQFIDFVHQIITREKDGIKQLKDYINTFYKIK